MTIYSNINKYFKIKNYLHFLVEYINYLINN